MGTKRTRATAGAADDAAERRLLTSLGTGARWLVGVVLVAVVGALVTVIVPRMFGSPELSAQLSDVTVDDRVSLEEFAIRNDMLAALTPRDGAALVLASATLREDAGAHSAQPTAAPSDGPALPERPSPNARRTPPSEPRTTPDEPPATPAQPRTTPDEPAQPRTTPDEPPATPAQPRTTPDEPPATPAQPRTTPEQPPATPEQPRTTPGGPRPTPTPAQGEAKVETPVLDGREADRLGRGVQAALAGAQLAAGDEPTAGSLRLPAECDDSPLSQACGLTSLQEHMRIGAGAISVRQIADSLTQVFEGTRTARAQSDPRKLDLVGVMVNFSIALTGFRGETVDVRWTLHRRGSGSLPPRAWLRDQRALLLRGEADRDSASPSFWVPLPRVRGPFFIRVSVRNAAGTRLDFVDSPTFN